MKKMQNKYLACLILILFTVLLTSCAFVQSDTPPQTSAAEKNVFNTAESSDNISAAPPDKSVEKSKLPHNSAKEKDAFESFITDGSSAGTNSNMTDNTFVITDYQVSVYISEENVYDVSETISVDFNQNKHGISREISTNLNGIQAILSDISVENWKYTVDQNNGNVSVKIGDPLQTVTGAQTYKISYKLSLGDNSEEMYDEVYFNIIDPGWPTAINHSAFSITLPKPFEDKNLIYSFGPQGLSNFDDGDFENTIEENSVHGEILTSLPPFYGVVIRIALPQGYFDSDNA